MADVVSKAVKKLYEFFEQLDNSMFIDDEHKSMTLEGCETLLNRKVKISDAANVVPLLGYPEECVKVYELFIQHAKGNKEESVADLRNSVAELLAKTAQKSDNFTISFEK